VVLVVLLALVLALVISLALTLVNTRLDAGFMDRWMRSFLIAGVAAVPSALLANPVLKVMVERLTRR
jgi:hypothetical protein